MSNALRLVTIWIHFKLYVDNCQSLQARTKFKRSLLVIEKYNLKIYAMSIQYTIKYRYVYHTTTQLSKTPVFSYIIETR